MWEDLTCTCRTVCLGNSDTFHRAGNRLREVEGLKVEVIVGHCALKLGFCLLHEGTLARDAALCVLHSGLRRCSSAGVFLNVSVHRAWTQGSCGQGLPWTQGRSVPGQEWLHWDVLLGRRLLRLTAGPVRSLCGWSWLREPGSQGAGGHWPA